MQARASRRRVQLRERERDRVPPSPQRQYPIVYPVIPLYPATRRRFYQGSTDHRGTEAFPGRTVTLERCEETEVCWGAAYRVAPENVERVVELLEIREKQYDLRVQLDLYYYVDDDDDDGGKYVHGNNGDDGDEEARVVNAGKVRRRGEPNVVRGALTYIATSDPANLNWLGPASVEDVAAQIAAAEGPSGPNREYLFNLAEVRMEKKCRPRQFILFSDMPENSIFFFLVRMMCELVEREREREQSYRTCIARVGPAPT